MQRQSGFTLIEIMVVVAILGILSAIAMPSYTSYVMRARLVEAHSALASAQPRLESHWANEHTYEGFSAVPGNTDNFDYDLTEADKSKYTLTATGKGAALGFGFSIDQDGTRVTTDAPAGWTTRDDCWIDRKEGLCSQ